MTSFKDKSFDFFTKAKLLYSKKAEEIAGSENKIRKLIEKVKLRLETVSHNPKIQEALEPILVFKRMLIAHKKKDFKVSGRTLGLIVLGLLYFVTPIDLIPDFIPVIGYVDDLSVLLAVFSAVRDEVEEFRKWEKTKLF
ncbi:Protein of unknown function (DUF1232) family [Indibacter alkaliphilus LW1]|jgi:uncharacterized membrane protein YkvA (DUF1232 family)|uniref:DUF1232 domain-containing protein n=1 Tax=Indibacter alkaliphilus (strain CCUG 57479 / KCTC 22604 / LW1) TaxID=1189612 RepID=S2DIN6_INDAL|nr:Protein of unknown function (DUF1232) family [Indibacter alkaliphilus LW1]